MKKQILVIGVMLISILAFGQKKEIKKAQKAVKSGDYNEAISFLNSAEGMLGSADADMKADFYATKANAYIGLANNDFEKMKMAADAIDKAIEIDPGMAEDLSQSVVDLRRLLINSAVKDQNAKNFKIAADKLYTSYRISPADTSDLYFAAGYAVNAEDLDKALDYYSKLYDMGYQGATVEYVATEKKTGKVEVFDSKVQRDILIKSGEYIKPEDRTADSKRADVLRNLTLIYIEKGDEEKAVKLMKEARAESPNDVSLLRAEADMAYNMGDLPKYNKLMNEIVATDPDNPEIYYNLGVGSSEIGNNEKAIEYYKKAIDLKPDYAAAIINIGVLKLNKEKAIVEEMNSLGTSRADNERYDELKEERNEMYEDVVTYFERALALQPDNIGLMNTLATIYTQLGEDEKYKAMKAKIAAKEGQ
ncbi:MAG: tetratricopeptide repeat protein [Flavobacteriales bacterium]|nr:tetratricopeptide repeat protein [Flavobacteriales bacterium]